MRQRTAGIFKDVDWMLLLLYLTLVLLGWMNIYAATYSEDHQNIFDISQSYGKQMLWILMASVLITGTLILEGKFFSGFAYGIYAFALALLAAVLVVGTEIKGAKSWFVIGGIFSIQPSEIAKFATALALSKYLSGFNIKMQKMGTRIRAVTILVIPASLILLQPDMGSVLVYASFIFVLYREGLSGNILLLGVGAAVLFVLSILLKTASIEFPFDITISGKFVLISILTIIAGVFYWIFKKIKGARTLIAATLIASAGFVLSVDYVFDHVLGAHQRDRINELLGVTYDPTGAGYNVNQSKIAIGSGGFFGKGYLQGTQTKYDFVPEQSTDFIFCTVGEEWGFVGSLTVITLFILLLFRIVLIAEKQKSQFSRIYGYCVASIFFFHLAINIGMTIGLAPVIGIPLPFFSYGGSSLWSFTLLLFTFIRLDAEQRHILR